MKRDTWPGIDEKCLGAGCERPPGLARPIRLVLSDAQWEWARVIQVVGCGAFRLGFDGGLGGEAENMSLFAPVVRQVLAQSQECIPHGAVLGFAGLWSDHDAQSGRLAKT